MIIKPENATDLPANKVVTFAAFNNLEINQHFEKLLLMHYVRQMY